MRTCVVNNSNLFHIQKTAQNGDAANGIVRGPATGVADGTPFHVRTEEVLRHTSWVETRHCPELACDHCEFISLMESTLLRTDERDLTAGSGQWAAVGHVPWRR